MTFARKEREGEKVKKIFTKLENKKTLKNILRLNVKLEQKILKD